MTKWRVFVVVVLATLGFLIGTVLGVGDDTERHPRERVPLHQMHAR